MAERGVEISVNLIEFASYRDVQILFNWALWAHLWFLIHRANEDIVGIYQN